MLKKNHSEEILECYRHAKECRRRAEGELDQETRTDFLAMEDRWLSLAHNYEFAELLSGGLVENDAVAIEMPRTNRRWTLWNFSHMLRKFAH
jgi:hypothetical protein